MQFALLIHQPWERLENGGFSKDELAELGKEYGEISATPGLQQNVPFGPRSDAATVRVVDGKAVVTEETLGGIDATAGSVWIFEAENKDAAIEFAKKIPAARIGGAVEVRTVGIYW